MSNEVNEIVDVGGYDVITQALMELLNDYPALTTGQSIKFSKLSADGGIAMFAQSGGIVKTQVADIMGYVSQLCQYPFTVVYRASGLSEERKQSVKEWLDKLGCWLEKQTITIGQTNYKLSDYPTLTGTRKFKNIYRTTPAYLQSIESNNAENWIISITAEYKNEYQRS